MWICLSPRCCWRVSPRSDLTWSMHFLRRSAAGLENCKHCIPFLLSSDSTWLQCLCRALSSLTLKCSSWWFVQSCFGAGFAFGSSIPCCHVIHEEDGFILALVHWDQLLYLGTKSGKSSITFLNFQLKLFITWTSWYFLRGKDFLTFFDFFFKNQHQIKTQTPKPTNPKLTEKKI